jgi:hypothetical protein
VHASDEESRNTCPPSRLMQLRASKLFSNESESVVHAAVRARVAVSVALALLLPSVYFPSSVLVTRMCLISPLALFAVKEVQVNKSVGVSGSQHFRMSVAVTTSSLQGSGRRVVVLQSVLKSMRVVKLVHACLKA